MPNSCAQLVNNLRLANRITSAQSSTASLTTCMKSLSTWVQTSFIRKVVRRLSAPLSTLIFHSPPLIEHIFYPVSTAPIITTTKGKLKER